MRTLTIVGMFVVAFVLSAPQPIAQVQQSQADQELMNTARTKSLEVVPCKQITFLLDSEKSRPESQREFQRVLGWWGRGYISGAVYMISEKAQKAAIDFGLSVPVVAAHIETYCVTHEKDVPLDAIQDLLLKVLKTASPDKR